MTTDSDYQNPFDDVPNWYTEPEPDEAQSNADSVPPRTGGHLDTDTVTTARAGEPSANGPMLAILGGLALLVIGAVAVFTLAGGGGETSAEALVTGSCADDLRTESSARRAAQPIECDDSKWGEITSIFEASEFSQMPVIGEGFWVNADSTCQQMAGYDGRFIALAVAETDQEWADGNRTVVCLDVTI